MDECGIFVLNHGAGIFAYKTASQKNKGVNVGVYIPAPWSIGDIILNKRTY